MLSFFISCLHLGTFKMYTVDIPPTGTEFCHLAFLCSLLEHYRICHLRVPQRVQNIVVCLSFVLNLDRNISTRVSSRSYLVHRILSSVPLCPLLGLLRMYTINAQNIVTYLFASFSFDS